MISVCIATYNGEKYIKEQLNSILCQLSDNDEIIISDDGSADKTLKIVKEINDKRIKIFENKNLHGYAHNFENALKFASGDYIFFSDQDDVWLSNKVEIMLSYLKENNFIITDAYITNEKLEKQSRLSQWRKHKKGYFRNLYRSVYTGCTCAFTKEIKDYCLPFPQTKWIQHDNWIGLLSELRFNVVYIEEPLILYRRHQNNTSGVGSKSDKTHFFMFNYRVVLFFETLKRVIIRKFVNK